MFLCLCSDWFCGFDLREGSWFLSLYEKSFEVCIWLWQSLIVLRWPCVVNWYAWPLVYRLQSEVDAALYDREPVDPASQTVKLQTQVLVKKDKGQCQEKITITGFLDDLVQKLNHELLQHLKHVLIYNFQHMQCKLLMNSLTYSSMPKNVQPLLWVTGEKHVRRSECTAAL